jgi:hypothetical protein
VVLDSIETLFAHLRNLGALRSELQRLFHWLSDRGVTAIIKNGNDPSVGKTLELVATRKDGAEIPVEVSVTAAMIEGKWQIFGNVPRYIRTASEG